MNKDEIQLTKALIKLKAIKKIIDILQDLNLLENDENMKDYNIILDYYKFDEDDFTTFNVKVNAKSLGKYNLICDKSLLNFNFKLKDENSGFALFKIIREYFVMKNDLKFPSFQKNYNSQYNGLKYLKHEVETNHHVSLTSMIHTKKDEEKLTKFNKDIFNKYKTYIRKIHTVDFDKDEIQTLKAEKKKEIAFAVIDMLKELSNSNDNDKSYEIFMNYESFNECYIFKIQILKNNKSLPLNINFKLKDKSKGIQMLNDIVKYYIENTDIMFDGYSNKDNHNENINYSIIGQNRVNLSYIIPSIYSKESIIYFKNLIKAKNETKILEKAK